MKNRKQNVKNSFFIKIKNSINLFSNCFVLLSLLAIVSINCFCKKQSFSIMSSGYQSITPDDPYFGNSWHLSKIEADKAWEITTGFNSVSVAVLDSGIDNINPYVISDLSVNLDATNSLDLSQDLNGTPFCDYLHFSPTGSHGTRVAYILGANGDDGVNGSGVCWESNIVSIRCSGLSSGISFSDISDIFDENETNYRGDISIMNMSLGLAESSSQPSIPGVSDLITGINNYDGLIVVCAGNQSRDLDNTSYNVYPASISSNNMIVVGASDDDDEKLNYSNYGENKVDLFAPGENLLSPVYFSNDGTNVIYGGMQGFDGTSGATPLVTGTAVLIKSVNPSLTSSQIKQLILDNVDQVDGLNNLCVSGGRLNAYKAVKAAIPEITVFNSFINAIQPLPSNKHQFYKISLTPGNYTFETSGSLYTSGCLYGVDIETGPIASSTNQSGNFTLSFPTIKNRDVYLKVTNNSSITGTYSLKVTNSHTHSYNYHYLNYNSYSHKAYCSCGLYQIKPHIANGLNNVCIMCGGIYSDPLSSPESNIVNVGTDSVILSNGVVVLGINDYNAFLFGALDVDSWVGGMSQ